MYEVPIRGTGIVSERYFVSCLLIFNYPYCFSATGRGEVGPESILSASLFVQYTSGFVLSENTLFGSRLVLFFAWNCVIRIPCGSLFTDRDNGTKLLVPCFNERSENSDQIVYLVFLAGNYKLIIVFFFLLFFTGLFTRDRSPVARFLLLSANPRT